MTMAIRELELFPFIDAGHRFYPQLEQWRERIATHPEYPYLVARLERSQRTIVHAEIKAQITSQGWTLDRFYWSIQYWDRPQTYQFDALTLNYSAKTGQSEWSTFPNDAYLPTMSAFFEQQYYPGSALRCSILRYVPLRRLTFRVTPAIGNSALMIGKFKRATRFAEAYARIEAVAAGMEHSDCSFAVAKPLGIDHGRCLYFQEALLGTDLATGIDARNALGTLMQVGAIHHELHSLDIPGTPIWQFNALLVQLQRDLSWISFCCPEQARFLSVVQRDLMRNMPPDEPEAYTFCHGDFVCSQLLRQHDQWSITDFDLCHIGDPYAELATLLTSLSYDVALFREPGYTALRDEAGEAYLTAYQQRAGRSLDRGRLTWYRICSEIGYLAMMLKKDWYSEEGFAAAIERIYFLREDLQIHTGGLH